MMSLRDFLRARLAEMQLAMMLLTRFPAGLIKDPVPPMAAACWAYPLAGLAVGATTALVLSGALWLGLPPAIAAGLSLVAGVVATGGLHEDGLADVADSVGGGQSRDRKLEIMRDSRIGSYGALALILALGLRWSALEAIASHGVILAATAIVAVAVSSRAGLPVILYLLPAARNNGLGKSAAGPTVMRVAVAVAIGLLTLALLTSGSIPLAIAIGQCITLLLGARLAFRQIGGQTGDVLGAIQQATDLCAWLLLVGLGH